MRVVHFGYADDLPGAARASYRLHRALVDRGIDSRMVVALDVTGDPTVVGPQGAIPTAIARAANRADASVTRLLTRGRPEHSLAAFGSGMVRAARALAPDIVHLHWIAGGLVRPRGLRTFSKHPIVWRLPDEWPYRGTAHYEEAAGDTAIEQLAIARKVRAIEGLPRLTVVTPTAWLAAEARASRVLRGRRVEVIPTGIDLERWIPGDRVRARDRFGLRRDEPVVLFGAAGGGENPRKGWDLLLGALRRLDSSVRLLTFGAIDAPADLRPRTVDLGRVDDEAMLADAYRAADVFVAPSRQENLANTGIESLACGTPVVAFAVGGMRELVEHERSGWLAIPFDSASLAAGVEWALAGSHRDAARRRAEACFDLAAAASRYIALYEELIAT